MKDVLTTQEAAQIIGVTDGRIRQLILAGILPAQKFGRSNVIKLKDLKRVQQKEHGNKKKAA